MKGRLSSAQATSEEKRLRTRPVGVASKKVTGAWEEGCGWARAGASGEAMEAAPGGGGLGGKAQGREEERSKVSPEFGGTEAGLEELRGRIPQVGKRQSLPSLWLAGALRGQAGHPSTSVLGMPTPLSRAGS